MISVQRDIGVAYRDSRCDIGHSQSYVEQVPLRYDLAIA